MNMRLSLMFTFIVASFCAVAQITSREVAKPYLKPEIYDSTYYFYKPDTKLNFFVNQELYILPKSKSYSKSSKENLDFLYFYTKPSIAIPSNNKYIYNRSGKNRTIYDTLVNKRLRILDVIYWGNNWKIKMLRLDNNDTVYFCPATAYELFDELPFILVGYYDKQKDLFLNKTFFAKEEFEKYREDNVHRYPIYDLNSGLKVNCIKHSRWKCIDLTFINTDEYEFMLPVLIFKNNEGVEIAVNFAKYLYDSDSKGLCLPYKSAKIDDFYTSDEFEILVQKNKQKENELKLKEISKQKRKEQLIKKYGVQLAELIINSKITIGMTKDMCKESWGMPINVDKVTNESGIFEVWQYDYKTFLYFENNILKMIKE